MNILRRVARNANVLSFTTLFMNVNINKADIDMKAILSEVSAMPMIVSDPTVCTVCTVWKYVVYPNFLNSEEHWLGVMHNLPFVICVDTTLCCRKSRPSKELLSNLNKYLEPKISKITVRRANILREIFFRWYLFPVTTIVVSKNKDVAMIIVDVML